MSDILEVVFSCSNTDNQLTCMAWDFRTGTNLMTYKGGGSAQKYCLNILNSEYVFVANKNKPLMHVWPINGQEQITAVRFVLPGCANALSLSPDGCYLVAGIQETIYVWHLQTGRMLNTIAKHYQPITCLCFTDSGSHFASASQDGSVLVWNLTQVVVHNRDETLTPLYSFADHGLPVTGVHIGAGGMKAYMITVSLDRTCKVYDLSCGILLLSVVFSESLQCVTTNSIETCIYVGSTEGNIYEFHTDSLPRTKEYHLEKKISNVFEGHKSGTTVHCLVLSLDGQTLISGGQDHQICVWHIRSRQLLKKFPQKGEVTNLQIRLTNPAIFHPEHKQPRVFCGNLKRMIDTLDNDDGDIIEVLVTERDTRGQSNFQSKSQFLNKYVTGACTEKKTNANVQNEEEIANLRKKVEYLERINKKLVVATSKSVLCKKPNQLF